MSSGSDVPKAKTVKPMIYAGIDRASAICVAASMSHSLPFHSNRKPNDNTVNETSSIPTQNTGKQAQ